jgi:hypothetical protein
MNKFLTPLAIRGRVDRNSYQRIEPLKAATSIIWFDTKTRKLTLNGKRCSRAKVKRRGADTVAQARSEEGERSGLT